MLYITKDFNIFVIYNHKEKIDGITTDYETFYIVLGGKDIKMNNNMGTSYKPGQIICCKSDDCWIYISVLHNTQLQNASGAMQLHTCCDLSIDGDDGSKTITFARGNGTLLDVDTTFEYVREATDVEREYLYKVLVKAFKDHDLGWDKHFTDSTYFDILDWLAWEFSVDLDDEANQNTPLGETMSEIQNYIWDALCKETGNYQACTDYVEPEMVNKDEFIAKLKTWLKINTNWDMEYDEEGRNDSYGKI